MHARLQLGLSLLIAQRYCKMDRGHHPQLVPPSPRTSLHLPRKLNWAGRVGPIIMAFPGLHLTRGLHDVQPSLQLQTRHAPSRRCRAATAALTISASSCCALLQLTVCRPALSCAHPMAYMDHGLVGLAGCCDVPYMLESPDVAASVQRLVRVGLVRSICACRQVVFTGSYRIGC